jgi:hypothetical protein
LRWWALTQLLFHKCLLEPALELEVIFLYVRRKAQG